MLSLAPQAIDVEGFSVSNIVSRSVSFPRHHDGQYIKLEIEDGIRLFDGVRGGASNPSDCTARSSKE